MSIQLSETLRTCLVTREFFHLLEKWKAFMHSFMTTIITIYQHHHTYISDLLLTPPPPTPTIQCGSQHLPSLPLLLSLHISTHLYVSTHSHIPTLPLFPLPSPLPPTIMCLQTHSHLVTFLHHHYNYHCLFHPNYLPTYTIMATYLYPPTHPDRHYHFLIPLPFTTHIFTSMKY